MKKIGCSILALLIALQTPLALADDTPAISIRQALDLAEKAKAVRENSDKVYILSIALERTSIIGGKPVWIAKWSGPLPANDPRDRDIGVQIFMDGSVRHIVKGQSAK